MQDPLVTKSLLQNIIILWSHLGRRRRIQFALLLLLMLLAVFAERLDTEAVERAP